MTRKFSSSREVRERAATPTSSATLSRVARKRLETRSKRFRVGAKKIAYCSACYYCREHGGKCVHQDDMAEILQKMIDADVIVLASPVYFYSIDAQLKAVIDRTLARWTEVRNKEFYYIVTMADTDEASADTTLACFRGYADCVNGAVEKGVIIGSGVYEPGKVKDTPAMKEAYQDRAEMSENKEELSWNTQLSITESECRWRESEPSCSRQTKPKIR